MVSDNCAKSHPVRGKKKKKKKRVQLLVGWSMIENYCIKIFLVIRKCTWGRALTQLRYVYNTATNPLPSLTSLSCITNT
jgi:hypothetical protein